MIDSDHSSHPFSVKILNITKFSLEVDQAQFIAVLEGPIKGSWFPVPRSFLGRWPFGYIP
jgi:hypothetical protein